MDNTLGFIDRGSNACAVRLAAILTLTVKQNCALKIMKISVSYNSNYKYFMLQNTDIAYLF